MDGCLYSEVARLNRHEEAEIGPAAVPAAGSSSDFADVAAARLSSRLVMR